MKQQNKWEKLFDEFLDLTEFRLVKYKSYEEEYDPAPWGLIDNQRGNIGDIESKRFIDAEEIFLNMSSYIEDYIATPLEQELVKNGLDAEELYSFDEFLFCRDVLPESKWDFDVLDMICNHFEEINLKNCTYEEGN